jgi:hypothetical protein
MALKLWSLKRFKNERWKEARSKEQMSGVISRGTSEKNLNHEHRHEFNPQKYIRSFDLIIDVVQLPCKNDLSLCTRHNQYVFMRTEQS